MNLFMGNGQNGRYLMTNVLLKKVPGPDLEPGLVQILNQNMVGKTAMLTKKLEKLLKVKYIFLYIKTVSFLCLLSALLN